MITATWRGSRPRSISSSRALSAVPGLATMSRSITQRVYGSRRPYNWRFFMKTLSVLGSTGSIGRSALDVVEAFPDRFRVVALAAGRSVERLAEQVLAHEPELVSVSGQQEAEALKALLPRQGRVR